MSDFDLPNKWVETTLSDVVEWTSGGTPKSGVGEYYNGGTIDWLNISDLKDTYIHKAEKKITELGLKNSSAKIVNSNSVLIAIYGSIGKLGINTVPVATNQAICFTKSIPNQLNIKFLFYYLMSIRAFLTSLGKGGTQQNISQTVLNSVRLPLAPLNEQNRIVAKIEALFSEIDNGIDSLSKAKFQLEQYRQSLLKSAFEGKLTEQWRADYEKNTGKPLPTADELLKQIQDARQAHYDQQLAEWELAVKAWEENGKEGRKPTKPSLLKLGEISPNEKDFGIAGWINVKINQIADMYTGSTPLKSNADYYKNGSIPWVTSGSLNQNYVTEPNGYITDLALSETNLNLLPQHTLLVAMYGEGKTRGKCSELLIEATTNQAIAGIVIDNKFSTTKNYLKLFLQKNYIDLRRQSSGGVQPNLNLGLVSNIVFPMPSEEEQKRIIDILEHNLSEADKNMSDINDQIKKAEILKSAILQKAFQGKLVPQDDNDPPASNLLEQIKQEREQALALIQEAKQAKKADKPKTPKRTKKAKTTENQ